MARIGLGPGPAVYATDAGSAPPDVLAEEQEAQELQQAAAAHAEEQEAAPSPAQAAGGAGPLGASKRPASGGSRYNLRSRGRDKRAKRD